MEGDTTETIIKAGRHNLEREKIFIEAIVGANANRTSKWFKVEGYDIATWVLEDVAFTGTVTARVSPNDGKNFVGTTLAVPSVADKTNIKGPIQSIQIDVVRTAGTVTILIYGERRP